jgi:hypothetical protein
MPNKYNPFRPDSITPPGLFAGRIDEIDYIESCLRQAKASNPKHFLVAGGRGIGKSSLVLYAQNYAQGKIAPKRGKKPFNFTVLSIALRRDDTFLMIIERVAKALKHEMDERDKMVAFAAKSVEFLARFEAAGIKYNAQANAGADEAFDALLDDFESAILKGGKAHDGILLLMDEADGPAAKANLGLFCKLLTEEMAKRETDKVCIGLAGLPALAGKLSESHPSSLRLFQTLNLKPLEVPERKFVVERALREANWRNSMDCAIESGAIELISDYSEGYPHFLQEYAYCAFEQDNDYIIDTADFMDSLLKKDGAYDRLGSKYFKDQYGTLGSNEYRRVLNVMAKRQDGWISRAEIISEGKFKAATVANALRALKVKGIIVQDEHRTGHYRLPTRSFAAWINIQNKTPS